MALHPMGFSVPRHLRFERCALTAPFHPYRIDCSIRRFVFCGTVRQRASRQRRPRVSPAKPELRGIAPCGVRTFLRSLARPAILRLPKIGDKSNAVARSSKAPKSIAFEQLFRFSVNPPVIRLLPLASLFAAFAQAAVTYAPSNLAPPLPAREFRGAWVASVSNIDWPSKRGLPTEEQKRELLAILDKCQQLKLNVVILQVRPACDALYSSKIEPWSEYLTGVPGRAPNPFWDPLEFAVAHAHARGMELHAWFNPFRARHSSGSAKLSADHVSNTRPAIAKTYGKSLWLDPGLQEVHDYSARVILDVVSRYDIDGVHIDDYFYPYPEKDSAKKDIPFPDWTSWLNYQRSGGKLSRDDWRRDNVNRFVARLYRDVHSVKPWVKVGISPFGIYRPGYPAQIKGFDQYESIYADPRTWLAQGWLDYLAPQLYWRIDPPATSFPVLLKWWTQNNPRRRMIVPGMNTTAIGSMGTASVADAGNRGWPASEIIRQIQITRESSAAGHIHWNVSALMKNKGGVADELRRAYNSPALVPALNGSVNRLSAPRLRGNVTSKGAEFRCEPPSDPNIRFLVVQARRDDGTWQTRIDPARSFTQTQNPAPAIVSVRAVDKFGNVGAPVMLERKQVPDPQRSTPRTAPQSKGATPPRRVQ